MCYLGFQLPCFPIRTVTFHGYINEVVKRRKIHSGYRKHQGKHENLLILSRTDVASTSSSTANNLDLQMPHPKKVRAHNGMYASSSLPQYANYVIIESLSILLTAKSQPPLNAYIQSMSTSVAYVVSVSSAILITVTLKFGFNCCERGQKGISTLYDGNSSQLSILKHRSLG